MKGWRGDVAFGLCAGLTYLVLVALTDLPGWNLVLAASAGVTAGYLFVIAVRRP